MKQWLGGATPKAGSEWQGWFGGGKAPSFAMDFAACWVNNPRDMIQLQNAMWYLSMWWSNQLEPTSHWSTADPTSMRPSPTESRTSLPCSSLSLALPSPSPLSLAGSYWGWNEVPVTGEAMDDPANWDAIVLKLPAAICGGQRYRHLTRTEHSAS